VPESQSFVAGLLVSIARERRTGVLKLEAERATTFLYFRDGAVVFAEQGTLGDTLGRVLVASGRLSQSEYAAVIDRMTERLVDNEQMRFGEAAIQLGFLTAADVHEALKLQVRRKLVHCLQWDAVECSFAETDEPIREVAHFPSDVVALVVEGIRRFWDVELLEATLAPWWQSYVKVAREAVDPSDRFGLSPPESAFVRGLDGSRTLAQVAEASRLDHILVRQLLASLLVVEALELHEREASAQASLRPPPRVGIGTVRRRADEVVKLLRSAMDDRSEDGTVLSAEHRARLEGEAAFQRGVKYMREGVWVRAASELRTAVELCPEHPEYELYERWAAFRTAPADADRDALVAELVELVRRALTADLELAFGWHVRAQLAAIAGDDDRAHKAFRRALQLDPADREAERWVRLLEIRRTKKR
jgi:tetratricopeptide (TPR) repeat protein